MLALHSSDDTHLNGGFNMRGRVHATSRRNCALYALLVALVYTGNAPAASAQQPPPTFACTAADATCSALGDLYYATNGSWWTNNTGWSSAASGSASDYCGFYGARCSGSALTYLCVPASHCCMPRGRQAVG